MTLFGAVVALILGVLLGRAWGPSSAIGVTVIALVAGVGAVRTCGWVRSAALLVAMLCAGCAGMQRAERGLARSPIAVLVRTHAVATMRAQLVDDPDVRTHVARAVLRVQSFERSGDGPTSGGRRRVEVVATGEWANRLVLLRAGDRVALTAVFEALGPRDGGLHDRHVVARARVIRLEGFAPAARGFTGVANAVRACILRGLAPMPMPARALASGFLLGDTSAVPSETVRAFRASGLSHLLAVSGANLAFAAACVAPFLRRFGLTGRCVGGLGVVILFATMTRFEPSVVRASAMAVLVLLADRLGRPATALRILGLATIATVLVDPLLVFRPGFQLSVGATFGLAAFAQPIAARLWGPPGLRLALAAPISAQLGVLPVSLAVFGAVPLISVPANVVAEPLAGPITIVGLITAVIGGLLADSWPSLAAVLQYPTVGLINAVRGVAVLAAQVPLAAGPRTVIGLLAVLGGGVGARWFGRSSPDRNPGPASDGPLSSAPTDRRTDAHHLHSHY